MVESEERIVVDFASGGEDAFREIYETNAPLLRFFTYKYIDDPDEVDDIVQDAFVALWKKRASFSTLRAVKAYLYQSVRTTSIDILRHRKVHDKYERRQSLHTERSEKETFLDNIMETEILRMVAEAFDELTPACKEVYELSLRGLDQYQIAEALDISVNTVKKHKNNAHHYMRRRLKNARWP